MSNFTIADGNLRRSPSFSQKTARRFLVFGNAFSNTVNALVAIFRQFHAGEKTYVECGMRTTVVIGSKLRKKDAPDYILEVVELFTPRGDAPHARARVSITSHDLGVRLYAVSALEDHRLFVPVSAPQA